MRLPRRRIVIALLEAIPVKADLYGVFDQLRAGSRPAALDEEAIVQAPERRAALFAGADHRVADPFGSHTDVGDVDELEPGNTCPDEFFDQSRLNLSRDTAAFWSKRIAVFDDQHRRVGVADDVALDDQSVAMAAADCLDV